MSPVKCPKCSTDCLSSDTFCRECGAPLQAQQVEQYDQRPGRAMAVGYWLLDLLPGLVHPKVLVLSLLLLPVAAAVAWLAIFLLLLGALLPGVFIAGFALFIYCTAVAWLVYGYVCAPTEALADFDEKRWIVFLSLSFLPVAIIFSLMK